MRVEGTNTFVIEPQDYLLLGPQCSRKVEKLGITKVGDIIYAIAWAYSHWRADDIATNEGWPPQWTDDDYEVIRKR